MPLTLRKTPSRQHGWASQRFKGPRWSSPAVILNIQRQPGANIIGVVDSIQQLLPKLQATLPASIRLEVLTDRTNTIRASVKDVEFELVLTIGLVILVIFSSCARLRATSSSVAFHSRSSVHSP